MSHDQWIAARKAYLAEEKAISKARDELARKRRELPWEKVGKNYVFDTPSGKQSLADLFGDNGQLIIYHFMLGPGWEPLPAVANRQSFRRCDHSPCPARYRLRRRLAHTAAGNRKVQGTHGLAIQWM